MRRVCFILGLCILGAMWLGPLPERAAHSFAAHMIMHMSVVAVAAPLLALGLAGSIYDPVRRLSPLFPPVPISLIELIIVWAWHAPALHYLARHSSGGLVIEQSMFLLSGLLVWLSAFGGEPQQRRPRAAAGVIALLLTSMHMTLLGALLALPLRPLYGHSTHVSLVAENCDSTQKNSLSLQERVRVRGSAIVAPSLYPSPWGRRDLSSCVPEESRIRLTPLQDQQLGGAIMLIVGGVSYLLGGLWLTAGLLKIPREQQTPQPREVSFLPWRKERA
jgi:putative membrane protein